MTSGRSGSSGWICEYIIIIKCICKLHVHVYTSTTRHGKGAQQSLSTLLTKFINGPDLCYIICMYIITCTCTCTCIYCTCLLFTSHIHVYAHTHTHTHKHSQTMCTLLKKDWSYGSYVILFQYTCICIWHQCTLSRKSQSPSYGIIIRWKDLCCIHILHVILHV